MSRPMTTSCQNTGEPGGSQTDVPAMASPSNTVITRAIILVPPGGTSGCLGHPPRVNHDERSWPQLATWTRRRRTCSASLPGARAPSVGARGSLPGTILPEEEEDQRHDDRADDRQHLNDVNIG